MFGFGPISNEKPGSHLPFDVPELEAVRTYIQNQVRSYRYILAMYAILIKYGLRSSQKDVSKKGVAKDQWSRHQAMSAIRHSIERSWTDYTIVRADVRKPQVMGGPAASTVVGEYMNCSFMVFDTCKYISTKDKRGGSKYSFFVSP